MSTARHQHLRATWVALVVLSALLAVPVVGFAADSEAAGSAGKIDLNRATAEELQDLPGIGASLALRIVEYRKENGPFQRIEDLMNVRGIGEKNFVKIRDRITVGAKQSSKG